MSFKNWYGTLLPFEAKALTREEIFQAGAASRDAEVAGLQEALKLARQGAELNFQVTKEEQAKNVRLLEAFTEVRNSLQFANDSPNGGINDTLWMMHRTSTIFDFTDSVLVAASLPRHWRK